MSRRGALVLSLVLFLCAVPASAASIALAWDPPATPGHDGYAVLRKTGMTGTYAEIGQIGLVLTYTDATAPSGQIVCYTVQSTLGTQRSAPSNEVCVATITAPLHLRIQ